MNRARIAAAFAACLAAGTIVLGPLEAAAADRSPRACLGKAEQRAAVAARRALPLGQVRNNLNLGNRKGVRGDVISARLCTGQHGLVYVLTVLARNGKVSRVTVDAATGAVLRGR
ncbi:MAG: PepSY domain-containing protein [Xanthobacteraceae bacterium]|uniref:PepSY domain-containing protein n=1 Tax=Pseudolabrys sp. TaxID=1960880 RepID=UPI003D10ED4D